MKTNQSHSWRIDASIKPHSYLKGIFSALWLFVVLLMIGFARLLWWQGLMIVCVLLFTLFFYWLQRHIITHITQPIVDAQQANVHKQRWFVYIHNTSLASKNSNLHHQHTDNHADTHYNDSYHNDNHDDKEELWQCQLLSVYGNRYVIILYFHVVSPYIRPLIIAIWRDQVVHNEWRKLQVMARYCK